MTNNNIETLEEYKFKRDIYLRGKKDLATTISQILELPPQTKKWLNIEIDSIDKELKELCE